MSAELYWRPAPVDRPLNGLPYELKRILGPRFWGHDGSVAGGPVTLDRTSLEYLAGLMDAGVPGAEELRDAIKEHGAVEIFIEA